MGQAIDSADQALATVLKGFAARSTEVSEDRHTIVTRVSRRSGFQNVGTTATGQTITLDEPADFGGKAEAPDPAEFLLAAIGASLSVTFTAHAALRDVPVRHIELSLKAAIDGHAFFAPGQGEPGLLDMEIDARVSSSAPRDRVRAVWDDAVAVAPVLQTLKALPRLSLIIEAE